MTIESLKKGSTKQTEKYSPFPLIEKREMQTLAKCIATCYACSQFCLEEGHKQTALLCLECAEICSLAYKFQSLNSEFTDQVFALCSQICKKCSAECAKMQVPHCQECAEICKRCSEAYSHQ